MKKLWFKNKTYGYGWTPSSWEGWLLLVVYFAILIKLFLAIDNRQHSGSDTLINFAPTFILLTIVLLVIVRYKGEKPRWQWGKRK